MGFNTLTVIMSITNNYSNTTGTGRLDVVSLKGERPWGMLRRRKSIHPTESNQENT